ncbi:MAG: hypothetical protein P8106_05455 [Gammaproteobacteria bacterium]
MVTLVSATSVLRTTRRGTARRQPLGDPLDLPLTGQEHQDVARPLRQRPPDQRNGQRLPFLHSAGPLGELGRYLVAAARGAHRNRAEQFAEWLGLQGRGHDQQPKVRAQGARHVQA